MKLLTKAVEAALEKAPLHSTEKLGTAAPIVVKFFHPVGRYTFYVTEGEKQDDGDWLLFGYCVSPLGADCDEYGYASLNELQAVKGPFGLGIERDLHFGPATLADVLPKTEEA